MSSVDGLDGRWASVSVLDNKTKGTEKKKKKREDKKKRYVLQELVLSGLMPVLYA
jgi:hypothetical protein